MSKKSRLKAWFQRVGKRRRASSKTTDNATPSFTAPAALESSPVESNTPSTPDDHVQAPATATESPAIPSRTDTHTCKDNNATLRRILDNRGYEGRLGEIGANYRYAVNRLAGTDLNWILGQASYLGHEDVVAELLAQHVPCSAISQYTVPPLDSDGYPLFNPESKESPGAGGEKPLHIAVCGKRPNIIRLLAANGADPNPRDETGRTPLHHAEDEAIVRTLLDCGEQIDARDSAGDTPLLATAREGRRAALEALVVNGADANERSASGRTAMWLIPLNDRKLLDPLMRGGADIVNARDAEGRTFLHVTVRKDCSVVVLALLNWGAHTEARGTPRAGRRFSTPYWARATER